MFASTYRLKQLKKKKRFISSQFYFIHVMPNHMSFKGHFKVETDNMCRETLQFSNMGGKKEIFLAGRNLRQNQT